MTTITTLGPPPARSSGLRQILSLICCGLMLLCWVPSLGLAQDRSPGEPAGTTEPAPAGEQEVAPDQAGGPPASPLPNASTMPPGNSDKAPDRGYGWLAIGGFIFLALVAGLAL